MSFNYEPDSEPLHISVKGLREVSRTPRTQRSWLWHGHTCLLQHTSWTHPPSPTHFLSTPAFLNTRHGHICLPQHTSWTHLPSSTHVMDTPAFLNTLHEHTCLPQHTAWTHQPSSSRRGVSRTTRTRPSWPGGRDGTARVWRETFPRPQCPTLEGEFQCQFQCFKAKSIPCLWNAELAGGEQDDADATILALAFQDGTVVSGTCTTPTTNPNLLISGLTACPQPF